MDPQFSLANTPVRLLGLIFFAGLLVAREIGYYLRRRSIGSGPDKDSEAFAMTSVLGLLALLIGFTFSIALSRYESRRELVVKEANAIGTTWLRMQLLDAGDRARMEALLRRYVDARVAFGTAKGPDAELAQYQRTVDLLVPVLADPRQIAELTDEDAIAAHKLVGLSYFFLSQTAKVDERPKLLEYAGIQFAALLFIDPDYVLDAAVEGPEAAQYFDAIKRDQSAQLAKIREQKHLDEVRKTRPQRERVVLTVVHDPAAWENFIPFGYPQFQNGETGKGAIDLEPSSGEPPLNWMTARPVTPVSASLAWVSCFTGVSPPRRTCASTLRGSCLSSLSWVTSPTLMPL